MPATRLWTVAIGAASVLVSSAVFCAAQTPKATTSKAAKTKVAPKGDAKAGVDSTDAKPAAPRTPWDDPSMQLRMLRARITGNGAGGFGGRGGPGGGGPGGRGNQGGRGDQGGGAPGPQTDPMITLLMESPALQEELKLTAKQKADLKKVTDTANTKRREFFSQMQGQGGRGGRGNQGGGPGGGGPGGAGAGGGIDRQAMFQMMSELNQQSATAIGKILDKNQKARLEQIKLRIEGVPAVARPEIAQKINMSEEQLALVQQVVEEGKVAQQELTRSMMANGRGMFGGRGGPGGAGGAAGQPDATKADAKTKTTAKTKAATTKAAPKNDDEEGDEPAAADAGAGAAAGANANGRGGRGNRPDMNSPEMQERMAQMTETINKSNQEADKIDAMVAAKIKKIISPGSRSKFNKLLGPEYDLTKLVPPRGARGGFGGPGGPGGGGPGGGGPGGPGGGRPGATTKAAPAEEEAP
jgi:DNA-binding TFAR19-related protein (PDSD5 family)